LVRHCLLPPRLIVRLAFNAAVPVVEWASPQLAAFMRPLVFVSESSDADTDTGTGAAKAAATAAGQQERWGTQHEIRPVVQDAVALAVCALAYMAVAWCRSVYWGRRTEELRRELAERSRQQQQQQQQHQQQPQQQQQQAHVQND
jgi:hypothetical protein